MVYKHFFPLCRLFFHFVDGFFYCEKGYQFVVPRFLFCFLFFRCRIQKSLPTLMSRNFIPVFSCENFMVPHLIFKPFKHIELIFVSVVKSLTCEYPIISALFIEEIIFSPFSILDSLIKYYLTVFAPIFSGVLFLFHWYICLFL